MGKVGFSPHVISKSGSLHSSTIRWQALAISVRTSNTTRSMLCRIARSPRGAPLDQLSHHNSSSTSAATTAAKTNSSNVLILHTAVIPVRRAGSTDFPCVGNCFCAGSHCWSSYASCEISGSDILNPCRRAVPPLWRRPHPRTRRSGQTRFLLRWNS